MIHVSGHSCETSPAVDLIARLVRQYGRDEAHRRVDAWMNTTSNIDGTALAHDWSFWARPKQRQEGNFVTCLYLTGRGWGKTFGISKYINHEITEGRVRSLGLAAQDESNSVLLQVTGPSGLIATAPPWNRPDWEVSSLQLVWPNGARAYVRTPEVPGKIRGFDYDMSWLSEMQSWPTATRYEAYTNFKTATRIGRMRMLMDATPKRGNPLLKELLAAAARDPVKNRVVRGTTYENAINLAYDYIPELEKALGGTSKGREELLGEMLEDSDGALVRQRWIDAARRAAPEKPSRRVLAIDPAVTQHKGSDNSGVVYGELGSDGQMYVVEDHSGKIGPSVWANKSLDIYQRRQCDLIVLETNKGGDTLCEIIRMAAKERGLEVVKVAKEAKPSHNSRVVYVKEVYAKGAKADRAQPAAVAYEAGRISHALGSNLTSLEETLTTWEPTPSADSPGDLDALAHLANELLDLNRDTPDGRSGFSGIRAAQQQIASPKPASTLNQQLFNALTLGGKTRL